MASTVMHNTLPHSPKEKKNMVEDLEPVIKEENMNPTNTLPSPAAEPLHTMDEVIEKTISSTTTIEKTLPPPLTISSNTTLMTKDQIRYATAIIRNLKKHRDASPFLQPVDHVQMNCPDYPIIITRPMDLNTVDCKLTQMEYNTVEDFILDVRLIFSNCYKYNGPEATVSLLCQNVESAFEKGLRQMPPSKELSPPLTSSPGSVVDEYKKKSLISSTTTTPTFNHFRQTSFEEGRPKREIHPPPSKDYPETLTNKRRNPYSNSMEMKYCIQTLKELKKTKYKDINYPFLHPVDYVALNIPDYPNIIKEPMDLSTIEHKLDEGIYLNANQFEKDIKLMFHNCYLYNPSTLPIYHMAKSLEHVFDEKWKQKPILPPPTPIASHPTSPMTSTSVPHTPTTSTKPRSRKRASSHSVSSSSKPSSKKIKYETFSESEEEEGDQEEDDRIAELERHLDTILQQLQSMKSSHKRTSSSSPKHKKSTTKNNNRKRALSDVTHKKSNPTSLHQNSKKSPTSLKKKSVDTSNVNNNKRKRRTTKKSSSHTLNHDILPEFTFEQKKHLSESINNLTGDRLNTVVNIIQSSMPSLNEGQEEIVLDIDSLDLKTLHQLHEFVTGYKITSTKSQPKHSRSQSSTSLENAQRLSRLEEQLRYLEENDTSSESDSSSDSDDSSDSD
ncbi:unnamed protein product [Cunninghamella blakesleeana]